MPVADWNANDVGPVLTPARIARPPHEQLLYEPTYDTFEHAQFPAFLKDWRLTRNGDIEMTLSVPFRFRGTVRYLSDALAIPLSVDVQRLKFREDEEDDA